MLVHGSKITARLYTQGLGPIRGIWFNTAGSFLLSYLIGMLCQAEGVTVMLGFALSTGFSQVYFMVENWIQENKGQPTIYAYLKHLAQGCGEAMQGMGVLLADFFRLVKFTLKVITFPFWGYRAVKEWFASLHTNIST